MATSGGKFYVYEHWRPDRGECFYVGKGHGGRAHAKSRRNQHHAAICRKLGRLGMSFEVRFVAVGLAEDEAFALEIERIAFWRADGADLTNMTDGGEGPAGLRHSEATKALWSSQRRGRQMPPEERKKRSAKLKGLKKTPEHAAAAGRAGGIARTGLKQSPASVQSRVQATLAARPNHFSNMARKRPVICMDDGKEYPSSAEAARAYNLTRDAVWSVCAKRQAHTKGKVFAFTEVDK